MRVSIFIDGNNFYFGLKKIYEDKKNLSDFDFEKFCNFLAGSDQSLSNTDDPDHKWIYDSWKGLDPRIPMVKANK